MLKVLYGLLIAGAILILVGGVLYVYCSREAESVSRGFVSKIIEANPDLVIDVGSYDYTLSGLKPSMSDVKIVNMSTKSVVKIKKIDLSISEDAGGRSYKYDLKHIQLNDNMVRRGWDVDRYLFQKKLFELLKNPETGMVEFDAYGKIDFRNGGNNLVIQNVISLGQGPKVLLSTSLTGADLLGDDFLRGVLSTEQTVFFRLISRLMNRVVFSRSLLSLEVEHPEKLYYDMMRLFFAEDRRNAKSLLDSHGKGIGWNDVYSAREASFLNYLYLKIDSDESATIKLGVDNEYRLSDFANIFEEGKRGRGDLFERVGFDAEVE